MFAPPILCAVGMVDAAPPVWLVLPFCFLLFLIAAAPLAIPHFWEKYYAHTAMALGLGVAIYYFAVLGDAAPLVHSVQEYVSFLALVGSLYVVSGGILIRVNGEAKPWVNSLYLLIGALLANVLGTTGASMLLIRPWIRMNKYRVTGFHIVFFIFIVSNVGGALTPIGDPPLFLGFLKGVPFWWMMRHCWQAWLLTTSLLLGVFYILDHRNFLRAPEKVREEETRHEEWQVDGLVNVPLVAGLLFAVLLPVFWRELVMVLFAVASWYVTPRRVHEANDFDFAPVKEVAWLFAGIFLTMVPALQVLSANTDSLGLSSDLHFFWATGALSGVLDNAPTYLAFLAAAFGVAGLNLDTDMTKFLEAKTSTLMAVSLGAVFFGALTYLGNGPNLMVKKIAEQQKVHTPSFMAYVLRYAFPVLLPIFGLVGLLFFSRWRVL
jgi:Na+/H+ antiporter NhaD/arsenite permease-like protein